ncbi:MAG: EVE domain-containing protein [Bdellovibrionales bacterium]|nr:EVE domain-containing protein [Bdellovibrionales bacterium]
MGRRSPRKESRHSPLEVNISNLKRFWLMKTEPDTFSIDDLKQKKCAPWDGVRNFQARNFMKEMKVGDEILFYHSSTEPPGVAGIARVCREAYPDHTSWDKKSDYFDPRSTPTTPLWMMVDVEFVAKFTRYVPLDVLRATPTLKNMWVLKRARLSVQPVTSAEFEKVCSMGR